MILFIDFSVIFVLILGIWQFRRPRAARVGNLTTAFALLCALVLVLYRHGIIDVRTVAVVLSAGAVLGYAVARMVTMVQIPAMVAFQHGAGGVAAFLVSLIELTREAHSLELVNEISGVLGLTIGSLTFSGSMIASAKLAGKMRQPPQILPAHRSLLVVNLATILAIGIVSFYASLSLSMYIYIALIIISVVFGVLFSIQVGGADMPVLISFLNATAGLAAALCGMVIENQLLIAFGATVAASGSILTHVMCKAMNRNVIRVFLPHHTRKPNARAQKTEPLSGNTQKASDPSLKNQEDRGLASALNLIQKAQRIIIVPGYGMALAKAQWEVADLAEKMIAMGKEVQYAVHPVAGRMPGHMNVLLAEVGVDYEMLVEMETINPEFPATDLVIVIGACDVVNPAAMNVEGSPISGMPILMAHTAKNVVCCNIDHKPGYSGVENPLYESSNTILLQDDAKNTVHQLLLLLESDLKTDNAIDREIECIENAANVLYNAKKVMIVPGYGMALAKAQFVMEEFATLLRKKGKDVKYAIHPVAGRMPGHMNVILAEADVEYDDLLEMDEVNTLFARTDVALVVGACDVVNTAAIDREGTPISGMPILLVNEAKHVIICNLDKNPGYSGVENPLYSDSKTISLLGDAQRTLRELCSAFSEIAAKDTD